MSTLRPVDIRGCPPNGSSGGPPSPSPSGVQQQHPNAGGGNNSLYGRLTNHPNTRPYLPSSEVGSKGGGSGGPIVRGPPPIVSSQVNYGGRPPRYAPMAAGANTGGFSSRPPGGGGELRYVQYTVPPNPPHRHPIASAATSISSSQAQYSSSSSDAATVYIQSGGSRFPLTSSSAVAMNSGGFGSPHHHPQFTSDGRLSLRNPPPQPSGNNAIYSNEAYLRGGDVLHRSQGSSSSSVAGPSSLPPAGLHSLSSIHSSGASSTQSTISTVAAVHGLEIPPKRPRLDLNPTPLSTPLRIDTREPSKDSAGYHPQVEAISPTGPEASAERDDLRSTKDDLLQKITKVDREIAKAESQIAKLKKKQQELEDTANRPSSDSHEEDEKPKNQSVAQIIYAENRKKAREAHASLDKLAPPNELPLYNQPSDTLSYHENKTNHAHFKKQLVEYFKKRNEDRESRERVMTETYSKLSSHWLKKVEKMEGSKKRRERESRSRELYEKIFPELRKQREDKERDHRLGSRGAVRSEADIENVIERLQEQELENKKMHSYAVIPPLLLPLEERRRKFINNNGLILDPLKEYEDRKFLNTWTEEEKQTFKERFLSHPKNFGLIASSLERKSVADAVQYYYLSKKTETYKQIIRKNRTGSRRRKVQTSAPEVIGPTAHGVVTRHRNREAEKMEPLEETSNRSTPLLKTEVKSEELMEGGGEDGNNTGDKKIKKETNDTSDDEDSSQIKSGPPHPCAVCKATVEASRPIQSKSYALQLGLREEDLSSDSRVCNKCHCIALRKRHGHCPIPTCTSTKGRGLKVKNRFRHLPSKWAELPDEIKGPIIAEMQLPEGIKKCCSGCVTRLTRKISQASSSSSSGVSSASSNSHHAHGGGGSSSGGIMGVDSVKSEEDGLWSEEEIERLKNCLREAGRNWALLGGKIPDKSPEQCKKFFYNNRKKYSLDKIVLDFKRANLGGDQPPTLSTDEESGSSTSSCDEESTYNNNSAAPASNSPAATTPNNSNPANASSSVASNSGISGISLPTSPLPPQASTSSSRGGTPAAAVAAPVENLSNRRDDNSGGPSSNDVTVMKNESENHIKSEAPEILPPPPSAVSSGSHHPKTILIKEEDNDSSTTMSADEVESREPPRSSIYANNLSGSYLHPQGGPRSYPQPGRPPPPFLPPTSRPQDGNPSGSVASNGPVKEVMTVRDLMSNVIERQLSSNQLSSPHHHPGGHALGGNSSSSGSSSSSSHPTIHTILENSGPAPHKTNYIRDRIGLNPLAQPQKTNHTMAPPPVPPANDCETLDLSMPRRREPPSATNGPPSSQSTAGSQYREPVAIHRSSYESRSSPPPAHSGSKAVTVPDPFRDLGRPYPPPERPHLMPRTPRGANLRFRPSGPAHKGPPLKPPPPSEKPLLIQTGSITQGTPVNLPHHHSHMLPSHHAQQQQISHHSASAHQHSSRANMSAAYEPLLRVNPPDKPSGSITHGTPVYEKKVYERKDYYHGPPATNSAPGSGGSSSGQPRYSSGSSPAGDGGRSSSGSNAEAPSQLGSRAVIMNDFAMARSNEMQRRPDSRESVAARSVSPRYTTSNRDHSPQQRMPLTDPRAALAPDRRVPYSAPSSAATSSSSIHRVIPDIRGDPKADIVSLTTASSRSNSGSPAVIDYRNETGSSRRVAERHRAISAAMQAAAYPPPGYPPIYMTPDGKYVPLHRSPSRSTPPPPHTSSSVSAVPSRPRIASGITSGKPVLSGSSANIGNCSSVSSAAHIDYYRGHPEVTISKTSPRLVSTVYNDQNPLNSLVDVAVKQPKLPDPKLLEHAAGGSKDGGKSAVSAAVAALHQQQTRIVAAAMQQKFGDRCYLPSGNQQLEAALAAVAAASNSSTSASAASPDAFGGSSSKGPTAEQKHLYKSLMHNSEYAASNHKAPTAASLTPHKIIETIIHQQQEYNQQQFMGASGGGAPKYGRSPALDLDKGFKAARRSPSTATTSASAMSALKPEANNPPDDRHDEYMWRQRLAPDERQITRVAQGLPPPPEKTSRSISPASGDPRYLVDLRRRLPAESGPPGKAPGGGVGACPMEYVNNKIVEEMKKNSEAAAAAAVMASAASMAPPSAAKQQTPQLLLGGKPGKRHAPPNGGGEEDGSNESPRKRVREDEQQQQQLLPDSPGSGEMVIDESARPDSVSSHKTASPAPRGGIGSSESQQQSSSSGGNNPHLPRYEPLSDDE